jgi:succinyldiaminopimelate transaminase
MSLNEVTLNLPNYPMEELSKIRQRLISQNKKVYDFGTGDPKIPTWAPIREAVAQSVTPISQYPATRGGPDLIESIWGYCNRNFGIKSGQGFDIMATNGSKEAIFHIALCLVGRAGGKKIIAYPDPGYPVYRSSALYAGGIPYPMHLKAENDFQMEPWTLPEDVQKNIAALWINYPHNPTGAILKKGHLEKIIEWCEKRDVVLLADDCYIDIYNPAWDKEGKKPLTPITYTSKNVYSFMSLSKRSGMTGYRSGFLIGDSRYMGLVGTARANMGVGTPTMLQKAAAVAWADDKHVAERRQIFAKRIELAIPYLQKLGMIEHKPEATFYLWCKVPKGMDDVAFCLRLAEEGVITSPSQWLSEGIKGSMRFALVPEDPDTVEAMEIVTRLVKNL